MRALTSKPFRYQARSWELARAAMQRNQEQQWDLWIDDAEMLIDLRIDQLGFTGVVDEAKRDYVVRQAVVAHIKKPDDATDVTIAVDDASSTRRYQSGKGRVSILDEWWDMLTPDASSAAFTTFEK